MSVVAVAMLLADLLGFCTKPEARSFTAVILRPKERGVAIYLSMLSIGPHRDWSSSVSGSLLELGIFAAA